MPDVKFKLIFRQELIGPDGKIMDGLDRTVERLSSVRELSDMSRMGLDVLSEVFDNMSYELKNNLKNNQQ